MFDLSIRDGGNNVGGLAVKEAGRTRERVFFLGNLWCGCFYNIYFLGMYISLSNLALSLSLLLLLRCCVYMLGNKNKGLMNAYKMTSKKWATVFGMRVGGWTKPILLLTECV